MSLIGQDDQGMGFHYIHSGQGEINGMEKGMTETNSEELAWIMRNYSLIAMLSTVSHGKANQEQRKQVSLTKQGSWGGSICLGFKSDIHKLHELSQ